MKKIFVVFCLLFIGCRTVDIIAYTATEEDWKSLESVEIELVKYFELNNKEYLNNVQNMLDTLSSKTSLNNKFNAKIEAYKILLELAQYNNLDKKSLKQLKLYSIFEPLIKIIETIHLPHNKKTTQLEKAAAQDEQSILLKTFLANNYLKTKNYKKAIVLYDQLASKNYSHQLTIHFRTRSNTLKKLSYSTTVDLDLNNITYKNVLNIFSKNSMLDFLNQTEPYLIFIELQEKNYIPLTSYIDETLTRKDFAKLSANIICENRYRLDQLEKIRVYYKNKLSPIQDLKTEDYFFAETVYLVENDYMELLDGTRFFPNDKITTEDITKITSN